MSEKKLRLCARQQGVELWSFHTPDYIVKDGATERKFIRWPKALRYFKWAVLQRVSKKPAVAAENGCLSAILSPFKLKIEMKGDGGGRVNVGILKWLKGKELPNGGWMKEGFKWPSPNDWGDFGWTFMDMEEATWHFHSLIYDHLDLEREGEWPCPGDWDRRNGPNWRWREGLTPQDGGFTPPRYQSAHMGHTLALH